MAKQPKRLVGPQQFAAAAATLYTAPSYSPSTQSTIIRHIRVQNPPGSGATKFTLSIGADAASKRIYDQHPLAAGAEYEAWCYYVLSSAEIIQGFADVATAMVVTIDGDENSG